MAWATKLDSGKWRGMYRDGSGKIQTVEGGPFKHKSEAQRRAGEAETESRRRLTLGHLDPNSLPTWAEWLPTWMKRRKVDDSTASSDLGRVNNYLLPKWGDTQLHKISRGEIREWIVELSKPRTEGKRPLSDSTVQQLVHLLSSSLQAAIEAELIQTNPARGLALKAPDNAREVYLTPDQFFSIMDEMKAEYALAAYLLVTTGMRLGEGIALHIPRIHTGSKLIEVRDAWDDKNRIMKAYPKGKSRRFVPLPEWILHEDLSSRRGATCGQMHADGKCSGRTFLQSTQGSTLDPARFRRHFVTACEMNGLDNVRIHDLRHTYASWLIQDGISLAEIGRLLGHRSPSTTARYAHLADVPTARVLAALPTRGNKKADAETKLRLVQ